MPPVMAAGAIGEGPQPGLTAGTLSLRPWGVEHVDALLAAYADPAVRRWHVQTYDRAEAEAYPGRWADLWSTGARVGWAVERDGVLAGRAALNGLNLETGQAAVAYWVVPAARGAGVATAAVEAVAAWAFGLGFRRLLLEHSTQNEASCRVAMRAGFALEGTLRQSGLHEDGWHDMHLHARLSTDR